ncbi:MAG: pyridoxamine 5'-phosphate oxidase family protein [Actinobacteria bacterium]|nr:pyridoxamine 5'-phosphate oxidase family protein [Actinomycetota bacterium]
MDTLPGRLPGRVEAVLNAALVAEFSVIGPDGLPITHPMIPLYDDGRIWLHSSILFSRKVEHVRRNPRVSVAVTDLGATHGEPLRDRVTVQGDATVHDGDVHEEWQRIMPLWVAKEPIVRPFYAKRVALPLFWERILIEIVPRRVLVWEGGRTDRPPEVLEMAETAP